MNKENKGMRLVAMIGKKKSDEYEVINFLPDIKVKHTEANNFEVSENSDYIKIPYADGIDDLTIIVGENGVGKTRLINNIFKLNSSFIFIYEVNEFMRKKYYCRNNSRKLQLSNNGEKVNKLSFKKSRGIVPIRFSTAIESSTEYQKMDFDLSTTYKLSNQNILETNQEDMANQIAFLFSIKNSYRIDDFLFNIENKVIVIQLEINSKNGNEFLNYIDFVKKNFGGEDDKREAIIELYDSDEDFSEYIEEYEEYEEYEDFLLEKYQNIIQSDSNYITYLEEKYFIKSEDYMNIDEGTLDSIDLSSFILDQNNVFDSINRMIKGYLCHVLCCKNLNNDISEPLKKFHKIAESSNMGKIFSFLPKPLKSIIKSFNMDNLINLIVDIAKNELDIFEDGHNILYFIQKQNKEVTELSKGFNDVESYLQNIDFLEDEVKGVLEDFEFSGINYYSDLEQVWTEISIEKRENFIESIRIEFLCKVGMEDIEIQLGKEKSLRDLKKKLLDRVSKDLELSDKFEELFDYNLVAMKIIFLEYYYERINNIVCYYGNVDLDSKYILEIIKKLPKEMYQVFEEKFLDLISYDESYIWLINYFLNHQKYHDIDISEILIYLGKFINIEIIQKLSRLTGYFLKEEQIQFKLNRESLEEIYEFIQFLREDFTITYDRNTFTKLNELSSYIKFNWLGLSSGEHSLLNLFGRIFSVVNRLKYEKKILLLLDEVDIGLHPEWQRKWVSEILPKIKEIFAEQHIQIIMTTHSPIMLSDIYSEDVILLQKDFLGKRVVGKKELRTFGQNIHELYRSSFFLESARGEYAMTQINETISTLYELQFWQDQKKRKNDIYKSFCYKRFNRQSSELPKDTYRDDQYFLSWFENYSSMKIFIEKKGIETKEEYEPFYERYHGNQVRKKGNYTKKFDDYYERDQSLISKVKKGECIFRTRSELDEGIINKFHYQYREKYHKLKEEILKESYFKNNDKKLSEDEKFKMVMKYRIDAIGESLIRKKMLSIYDGVYFSETPTEVTGNNLMDELDNLYKESIGNQDILLKIDELKELIKSEGK